MTDKQHSLPAELRRQASVLELQMLDTPAEERFDRITRLAAMAFRCPMASLSFIDDRRVWFKSRFGFEADELPRDLSICYHALQAEGPLIITDAAADPAFHAHPLFDGELMALRFYAGRMLRAPDGNRVGVLSVFDTEPHTLDTEQLRALDDFADMVEAELARDALRERADELVLHNEVLQQLSSQAPLPTVLAELARRIEAQHVDVRVSVLLLSDDGKHLLHGAAPSLPEFYNRSISGEVVGEGVGSCGTAIHRRQAVIVEDIETHPFWAGYRELARRAGLRSCWSFPIMDPNGRVLGSFALYRSVPSQPSAAEFAAIERYAELAGLVISRRTIETNLRISAVAFEALEGICVTDAEMMILRVNRAFSRITGFAAEEVIGRKMERAATDEQGLPLNIDSVWETVERTGSWHGELWNRRKNGEHYAAWLAITAVAGDDGAITHYVVSLIDISKRKAAEREIERLASYDVLTKLPNRRLLFGRLQQAIRATRDGTQAGALLFIDLDNFKNLNDTAGHNVGDLLLQQVAARLGTCTRETDLVARFGGDEFVVLLSGLYRDHAVADADTVAQRIIAAFARPFDLGGRTCVTTPSIGITLFDDPQDSVDEVLRRADLAMYQAKAAGRNTARFFDPKIDVGLNAKAKLEADLRQGLQRDEFFLHYQPQVDSEARLIGIEALARWRHPRRGMVSPAEFIPLAEEIGVIQALGDWVLRAACAQLAAWTERGVMADVTLAVNVSIRQFRHPQFVEHVLTALERTGVDPKRLKLELTESLLADDVDDTITKMNALKARGVGFSLDDFGTGYSSLAYLKRLPLDQLKIDKSFVRDVLTDPNDAAIVRTVVALADSMDLDVIAEGVETDQQRAFLAANGCLKYQGYWFGRPLAPEDLEQEWSDISRSA